jgi:hypothetical protein
MFSCQKGGGSVDFTTRLKDFDRSKRRRRILASHAGTETVALLISLPDQFGEIIPLHVIDPPILADKLDFAWDCHETAATLRSKLTATTSPGWLPTVAWLMREARVEQVWEFLTLQKVADHSSELSPMLVPRRPVREHLTRAVHELGRL